MSARGIWLISTGLSLVAVLTGCTATSQPMAEPEPSIGVVTVVTSPQQVVWPVGAVLPSIDQTLAIMLQEQRLIDNCAQLHGSNSRYLIGDNNDLAGLQALLLEDRRTQVTRNSFWGAFDPELMRRQGYVPADASSGMLASDEPGDPVQQACIRAVGTVTPTGHVTTPFSISLLPNGGPPWHPEDSRWVAAVAQWAQCMATRGYDYASPIEAISAHAYAAQNPASAPEVKALALAVAVADVDCKLETNLVGVGLAVQSAYDQLYLDANRDALVAQQAEIARFLAGDVVLPPISLEPSPVEPSP